MSLKPQSAPYPSDFDASDEMLKMLRAFEERPSVLGDASDEAVTASEPDPDISRDRAAMAQHLQLTSCSTRNALWSETWLYPVEAWSLILGLDIPFWESGWRECAKNERAGDWPHCALLLNELERLRSLRVLESNDDGKIRRDDAVRVAHALGYAIELGTPAFDILVHRWAVRPSAIRERADAGDRPTLSDGAFPWPLMQATVAVLTFFPDIAATAWREDAAKTILDTIESRQILPPSFFDAPADRAALEQTVARALELVARAHDGDKAAEA